MLGAQPDGLIGYLIRHGRTTMSPKPEGWRSIPLNEDGHRDAVAAANFLAGVVGSGWSRPDYVVASDLQRAIDTANVAAQALDISVIQTREGLRAYDSDQETGEEYQARTDKAVSDVLNGPGLPLIVAHRSTTANLEHTWRTQSGDDYVVDYATRTLLKEGGLMAITQTALLPLFRSAQ